MIKPVLFDVLVEKKTTAEAMASGGVGKAGWCLPEWATLVVLFCMKTWDFLVGTVTPGVVQGGCKEFIFAFYLLNPESSEKISWVL